MAHPLSQQRRQALVPFQMTSQTRPEDWRAKRSRGRAEQFDRQARATNRSVRGPQFCSSGGSAGANRGGGSGRGGKGGGGGAPSVSGGARGRGSGAAPPRNCT